MRRNNVVSCANYLNQSKKKILPKQCLVINSNRNLQIKVVNYAKIYVTFPYLNSSNLLTGLRY